MKKQTLVCDKEMSRDYFRNLHQQVKVEMFRDNTSLWGAGSYMTILSFWESSSFFVPSPGSLFPKGDAIPSS